MLAVDEIDDVVAVLFLEEGVVGDFDLDVIVDDDGDLVGVGVGVLQRHQLCARDGVGFVVIGRRRPLRRARQRGRLEDRSALRAGDRILVEIEKSCAAILTLMFIAEFWFCHGPTS